MLLTLTIAMAGKLGVAQARDPTPSELEEHVAPETVLDRIAQGEAEKARP